MARQRIKKTDLEKLKIILEKSKPILGHVVSRPVQTHENERRYNRKRDKKVDLSQ